MRWTFALILGFATLAGCSRGPHPSARADSDFPAVPVTIATAVQKPIAIQVRGSGNVEPSSTATIRSEVDGQLQKVHFAEGDMVRQGQLLFQIDARAYHDLIRKLEANLARSAAQARTAQTEAARYAELFKLGLIARQQYEQFEATAVGWQATLEADRAAIENARQQLNGSDIYSPMTGRTGVVMAAPGSMVAANTTALVTIHQIEPVLVSFTVSEKELPEIRARFGAGLHVEATAARDQSSYGKLTFIDNAVDASTGTIRMKATFPNSDRRLWPGQFTDVVITVTEEPDAIVLPSQAVQSGEKGQHVFVVTGEGKAEHRTVTVRRRAGDEAAVEGVLPGERVVMEGQSKLVPGSNVQVVSR
jgi:membrane fusion protein, multidrug efflux system